MYAVYINDDNTVSTLVNQRIYQGYKLSDWFWFLQKPYYNDKKMLEYTAIIQFTLPISKKILSEKIILKDEFYEGYLKYSISPKSKITDESGVVLAKIIFSDSNDNVVRETSEFKIGISTTDNWHNDNSFDESSGNESDNSGSNGCTCNSEEHIKEILDRTKPFIFESIKDAETQINSGTITNLYYGQVIVIKINDKYVPYTIQNGTNGYIVEPVDTIGCTEGLFWKENE